MILELDIPDIDNVQQIQNEAASFVRNEVQNVLDELLDKYDVPGKLVRIAKLELDLSDLDFKTIDRPMLKSALQDRLEQQLSELIYEASRQAESDFVIAPAQQNIELTDLSVDNIRLVVAYLQKGRIPWWASHIKEVRLNEELETLWKNEQELLLQALGDIIDDTSVRKRMAIQIAPDMLQNLMPEIADLSPESKSIFGKLIIHQENWKPYLASFNPRYGDTEKLAHLLDHIHPSGLEALDVNAETEQPLLLIHAIGKMQSISDTEKELQMKNLAKDYSDLISDEEIAQLITSSEIEEAPIQKGLNVEDFEVKEEKNLIPLSNAGLVILHPYLGPFFTAINLVENGSFVDEQAKHHAAYLLHFIATGSMEIPEEHELVFNKLACGIPIDEPIAPFSSFGEQEITECQELLSSVVENWTALKKTSNDGLREMYLKRPGQMRFENGAWVIKIEREAMDILIDKLPWGISMMKAPWHEEVVYIEW